MEIKDQISSGLLESYVLGLTSEEENRQVTNLIQQHTYIKEEIVAIEQALIAYASEQVKAPSAKIKDSVLSQINNSSEKKVIMHPAAVAEERNSNAIRLLVAASVSLFLISAAGNFYLYNNWKNAEHLVAALSNEKDQLAQELNVQQTKYKLMGSDMAVLQSPFNKHVMLKGMPVAPDAMAMVYWNTQTHEVFVNVHKLPAPPAGKQYQLWALADGKPIDAGVFDVTDTSHVQKMKVIENAQAFAVTLENAGGSSTPTLTAMYLMGEI